MTNRNASVASGELPLRRHSVVADGSRHSQSQASGGAAAAGRAQRPSSRNRSMSGESSRPTFSINADAGSRSGKKSKSSRKTSKKLPRRDSVHADPQAATGEEQHGPGFSPQLTRIQEGKVDKQLGDQASPTTITVGTESQTLWRRSSEDMLASEPLLHEAASNNLVDRAVSSSSSLLSCSMARPDALDDSHSMKRTKTVGRPTRVGKRKAVAEQKFSKSARKATPPQRMAEARSYASSLSRRDAVVDGVGEGSQHGISTPSFAALPCSVPGKEEEEDEDEDEDDLSSSAEHFSHVAESPSVSPASERKRHRRCDFPDINVPLYASSFVHGHEEREPEETRHDDRDESVYDDDDDDKECDGGGRRERYRPKVKSDFEGGVPQRGALSPDAPSTTCSSDTDPHTSRLRQQERDLANYVRMPRWPKEYRPYPSPSPHPHLPSPTTLYGPEEPAHISPAGFYNQHQAQGWSAIPSLPAPLSIGYMPTSPEGGPASLAMRPPEGVDQQDGPPSAAYPAPPLHLQPYGSSPDAAKATVVGYELLADKLSEAPTAPRGREDGLVPMYRKFEQLNHRVLLHLQDEICELEEELRYLDECIARLSPRDEGGRSYPASRRNDARYGGEVHYRRTELLGRIFQKLGQYNQALSAFHRLLKDVDPASAEARSAYRAWMEKRGPIDHAETRFLERKDDLVAVSRPAARQQPALQAAAVWLPLALILPLTAFAMIPSLTGRLAVMMLIGGAELAVVTSTPELMGVMSGREWVMAGLAYSTLNVLLASLVR